MELTVFGIFMSALAVLAFAAVVTAGWIGVLYLIKGLFQ